ncbi:MAG: hypothetical protein QNJ98_13690 [Planctomycetota bacterium]|nr:hypothetical protein [Planctomycetota bacterium]
MNTTRHIVWFTRAPAYAAGGYVAPADRMAFAGFDFQPDFRS